MKKIWIVLLIIAPLSAGFAVGGGGMLYQANIPFWEGVDNTGLEPYTLIQNGAFGYGVGWEGAKMGGFGLGIQDAANPEVGGGFGGLILGTYGRIGPFSLSLNGMLGIGGLNMPVYFDDFGGVALMAQGDLEVGIPILKWLQISVYGGVQFLWMMNPDRDFLRMPVAGVRLTFGSF